LKGSIGQRRIKEGIVIGNICDDGAEFHILFI
jgi:hypothetical protein